MLLTGKSRDKEVKFNDLKPPEQTEMKAAMATEWLAWRSFKAARGLTQMEFEDLRKRPGARVVDTRWF